MNFKSSFDFIVLVAEWRYMVVDIEKCNNCVFGVYFCDIIIY